jgi:small subunit ribosomal protein S21
MPKVKVYDGQFEKALRRFKKSVQNARVLEEVRSREAYEKPAEKRNRKKGAAKARYRKKLRQEKSKFQPTRWPRS